MNAMRFKNTAPSQDASSQRARAENSPWNLAAFAPQPAHTRPSSNSIIGLIAAGLIQAALFTALMFGTFDKAPPPSVAPLVVDILPVEEKEIPPPPPVTPHLATPNVTMVAPPSFQIYEPPPLVTAAAPPAPNAPVTSQVPVSGNADAVIESYQIKLLRHLNRHKRYPGGARTKREQGVVYVRFSMDRHGKVLASRIETSCRFADLNNEGLALLLRAQPLPMPPMEVAGDPIEMIVPVEFSLKN